MKLVYTPDSSQVSLVPLWGLRHIPNSDQALDRETQDQTRQLLGKHSASHSTQSGTTRNLTSDLTFSPVIDIVYSYRIPLADNLAFEKFPIEGLHNLLRNLLFS